MRKAVGKAPTGEQAKILQREGHNPRFMEVIRDLPHSMIVRDIQTNRMTTVDKDRRPI